MSSLETPQELYQYFYNCALHEDPPSSKWLIGLKAAQLWVAYHEQAQRNTDTLIELARVVMPFRFAGSGFYALWLTVLNSLRALPIIEQALIWRVIFDPTNHGERLLPHPERAEAVIKHWIEIEQQSASTPVDINALYALVKTFGPDLSATHEWISFGYSINTWFEDRLSEPIFMDLVFEQHNASLRR